MHNVEKLPNIVYIFCGIQASRFLKYVSPSFNMIEVTNGLNVMKSTFICRVNL